MEKASFAAGCFWGVEATFGKIKGVCSTRVGYLGGSLESPSYKDVCSGTTGHAEVVEIEYDPQQVSYKKLLEVFWEIHDPTTLNRQGPDAGTQYRSAIFYHNQKQKKLAEIAKKKLDNSKKYSQTIVTEIAPASTFYKAEEYHQHYLQKKGASHCRI